MAQLLGQHQGAAFAQHLDHVAIGLVHRLAGEELGTGQELAVGAHRVVHGQSVAQADDVVVLAVAGGGVHTAGAGLQGHVLAQDHGYLAVEEGVVQ